MDVMILKKKIDGYRATNGSIKHLPPELLLELRQTWEHYAGTPAQSRSELGMKTGTLRKFLVKSKKSWTENILVQKTSGYRTLTWKFFPNLQINRLEDLVVPLLEGGFLNTLARKHLVAFLFLATPCGACTGKE